MKLYFSAKSGFSRILLLLVFPIFTAPLYAQPPADYYNAASGLSGAALKTALYNIISNHTVISYSDLWTAYQTTDVRQDGKVWDMYSNCNFTFVSNQCGNYVLECDCYNREHSLPQSWFNEQSPMVSDIFHVVPTDGKVNGYRSNFPFGEVANPTVTTGNGSKLGPCSFPGYTGTVFEPIDEYKGDFARIYFYMATRYENVISGWCSNSTEADVVLQGNSFPVFEDWFLNLLAEWHENDPVSQKETDRNNAVYGIQHNRNPFVDNPGYVYEIWGVGLPSVLPEPESYPASFSAHNIQLQWSEATGTVLPDGYLIRMSSAGFDAIAAPVDGFTYSSPADFSVPYAAGELKVKNLEANTIYYFRIYSYTGSGETINYKTDGAIPQVMQRTGL
jgi:endonuclease I